MLHGLRVPRSHHGHSQVLLDVPDGPAQQGRQVHGDLVQNPKHIRRMFLPDVQQSLPVGAQVFRRNADVIVPSGLVMGRATPGAKDLA